MYFIPYGHQNSQNTKTAMRSYISETSIDIWDKRLGNFGAYRMVKAVKVINKIPCVKKRDLLKF